MTQVIRDRIVELEKQLYPALTRTEKELIEILHAMTTTVIDQDARIAHLERHIGPEVRP